MKILGREKGKFIGITGYSYTTLKYGMLINQNHEMSIKLKKKNETIESLKMMLKQGSEEHKASQRSSSEYNNEDDSFAKNYK